MVNSKSKSIRLLLISFLLFSCKTARLDEFVKNKVVGYYNGVQILDGIVFKYGNDNRQLHYTCFSFNDEISMIDFGIQIRIPRKQNINNMFYVQVFPGYSRWQANDDNLMYFVALESESMGLSIKDFFIEDFFRKGSSHFGDYEVPLSDSGTYFGFYFNCFLDLSYFISHDSYENDLTYSLFSLNTETNEEIRLTSMPFPEISVKGQEYVIDQIGCGYI